MSGCGTEYSVPELLGITIVAMFGSIDRNRLPWLLLAVVLMFGSASCALLYLDTMGRISGWIGLHEYEGFVPRLQWYARLWSALAVIFPFLAAFLLGFGKGAGSRRPEISRSSVITAPDVSHEWAAVTAILAYLLRVAVSAFASLAFIAVFILVVALLRKMGVWAH
jgi:hypothetical protein